VCELEDHQIDSEDLDYKPIRKRRWRNKDILVQARLKKQQLRLQRLQLLQPQQQQQTQHQHQQQHQQEQQQIDDENVVPFTMDEVCNAPGAFEILCHGCGYRHRTPHRHVTRNMNRLAATYPGVPFPDLTQLYFCCMWFKRGHPERFSNLKDWLAPTAPAFQRPVIGQFARRRKRNSDGFVKPIPTLTPSSTTPKPASVVVAHPTVAASAAPLVPIAPRKPQHVNQPLADTMQDRHRIHGNLRIALGNLRATLASMHDIVESALKEPIRNH
jgi:hypothetical protein